MLSMKNVALVLSGIVCGGGLLVATQQVFAQSGRGAPPFQGVRWEQGCEPAQNLIEANNLAALRGQQGWELISFANGAMCFKRPATPREPPPSASDPQPSRSRTDWGY
jgi:hypothetical protein